MAITAIRGKLVTDYEIWSGAAVLVENGTVEELSREGTVSSEDAELHDYGDSFLVPGFVDLQVNGCFGIDVATEPGRLTELSEKLLSTGVTSYLPTLISSPEDLYEDVMPVLAASVGEPSGAEYLGAHLEGPFISPQKRGAHPQAFVIPPDTALLDHWMDLCPVRMITIAPELPEAEKLIEFATGRGLVVSAGHSEASFEDAYAAFDHRVAGVTHLFNAMNSIHHRKPGVVGAAFAHPRVVCGLIVDGLHIHPEVAGLAFQMLGPDRLYLTTDATAATGMGPGEYALATRKIYQDANMVRLGDGALAGSLITMNEAFQNILAFTGCTLPEAARMASSTPARLIGEGRRKGRLVPGYDADITVLAPDLSVEAVWKNGQKVY
ncbi:MAG: N-acetylglucosamine-6-phosphate deacetylase [Rubrobacteraceae bacterium]